jgi:VCBS repeat-containing protein
MPTNEISVEFWVQTSSNNRVLFSYATSDTDNELLIFDAPDIQVLINGSSIDTNVDIADGEFHHLVLSWDSSTGGLKLYVDGDLSFTGVLEASQPISSGGTIVLGQEQDSLGGGFQNNQAFSGTLDEVAIYGSVLSDAQVQTHYQAALIGGVLDNDTDPDSTLTVTLVNESSFTSGSPIVLPSGATLTMYSDGSFQYDPTTSATLNALSEGEPYSDSFTYQASDGDSTSTATVTINVTGVNDPPVADADGNPDTATTDEDTPTGPINVLANDDDVDGDNANLIITHVDGQDIRIATGQTVTLTDGDGNVTGTVTLNSDETLTYTPNEEYFNHLQMGGPDGMDSFGYTIQDEQGAHSVSPGIVEITVTGVNDPPIVINEEFPVDGEPLRENDTITINLRGAADSDAMFFDPDTNDELTYTVKYVDKMGEAKTEVLSEGETTKELASGGTLTFKIIRTGKPSERMETVTYDQGTAFDHLAKDDEGTYMFTIIASDGSEDDDGNPIGEATANVQIKIKGINDPPELNFTDTTLLINQDDALRAEHDKLASNQDPLLNVDGIVEGENVQLTLTIVDVDDRATIEARLFLVPKLVYEGRSGRELIDGVDGVQQLDIRKTLGDPDNDDGYTGIFSDLIDDDDPAGDSPNEMVFVAQYKDEHGDWITQALPKDTYYQVYNFTPILIDASQNGETTIEFVLVGNEFEATVTGFVLEPSNSDAAPNVNSTQDPNVRPLQLTLSDGDGLSETKDVVDMQTVRSSNYNATLRSFSVTFRVPVTSELVNASGTELELTLIITDDDGGRSTLNVPVRFPPFVIPQQEAAVVEEDVVLEFQEIQAELSRIPTVVRQINRTQTPLSGEIETDTFEVLVRIVVDDGGDGENDEPLYRYIDLFDSENEGGEENQSKETIDQARSRLEQFLRMIPQLPDNRYQLVLRQKRGDLMVSDTVILDVIVQDGEIIERRGQIRNNGEQMAETTGPEPENASSSQNDVSGEPEQTDQVPTDKTDPVGAVALPALAIAEFRKRQKKAETEPPRRFEEPNSQSDHRKAGSLWRTLFRIGSSR